MAALLAPVASSPADASAAHRHAARQKSSSVVTKSTTVERTFIDDGKKTVVDPKRKVTLQVDQTTGLKSLQLIHVSWSGARPTGGIAPDLNTDLAMNEEYPMALFECRGTDSGKQSITPETCWTQYGAERFSTISDGYSDYPAWRSDADADASDRTAFVNQPKKLTDSCASLLSGTSTQRWVPFIGADGTTYAGGPKGCQSQPAEGSPVSASNSVALPSNETFGVTDTDGNGAADFDIFTGQDHASLGCSQTVACSLVAVPIEGINCDAAGTTLPAAERPAPSEIDDAQQACEQTGRFAPGRQLTRGDAGQTPVDGTLWWSASNWRNRISVPLSFAPADDACSLDSSQRSIDIYGSGVMSQATASWSSHFCLNSKLFGLNQVQVPEPQARSLLQTQGAEAVFTSEPPDSAYPYPTANAPVAVSGFAIAYDVDGPSGNQVEHLDLNARLLAKLLTESYPDQPFVRDAYPALSNNPLNITYDPEFQALNPGIPTRLVDSASTLLNLNTSSDVVEALTAYINADPEARAWLNGRPDPWGMVVNPNYKNISLPTNTWPLLDSFVPSDEYSVGHIDCLIGSPVPYLPLVAAPTSRLDYIAQDLQFGLSQSQTVCQLPPQTGSLIGAKMVAVGRQPAGTRTLFGVVALADAKRDGLSLASLESQSTVSRNDKITSAAGRTFVAPDNSSLRAASALLRPDVATGVWPVPNSSLRTTASGKDAYPGTMVMYTAVPTEGLPSSDAVDLGKFLYFTSSDGQVASAAQGDLPGGYLPMTSANGLGQLADYTSCAANAVAAQKGKLPSLTGGHCADEIAAKRARSSAHHPGTPSSPGTKNPQQGNSNGPGPGAGHGGGPTATSGTNSGGGTPAGGSSPSETPSSTSSSPGASSSAPAAVGASPVAAETPRIGSGVLGLALPLLFAVAILGGLGALVTRMRGGRHGAS